MPSLLSHLHQPSRHTTTPLLEVASLQKHPLPLLATSSANLLAANTVQSHRLVSPRLVPTVQQSLLHTRPSRGQLCQAARTPVALMPVAPFRQVVKTADAQDDPSSMVKLAANPNPDIGYASRALNPKMFSTVVDTVLKMSDGHRDLLPTLIGAMLANHILAGLLHMFTSSLATSTNNNTNTEAFHCHRIPPTPGYRMNNRDHTLVSTWRFTVHIPISSWFRSWLLLTRRKCCVGV